MKRNWRIGLLLAVPSLLFLALLFVYPVGFNLYNSLFHYEPLAGVKNFLGLENYFDLSKGMYLTYITNTVIFTIGSVSLEFLIGLSLALLLGQKLSESQRSKLLPFFVIPYLIPVVVYAVTWRYIFTPQISLVNSMLNTFIPWLSESNHAMAAIIFADTWKSIPVFLIILLGGVLSISMRQRESIRIDGASKWQEFRYVTLPKLKPFIFLAVVVRGIDAFTKVFGVAKLITGGGPGISTTPLPMAIHRKVLVNFEWGIGSAMATITLLFSVLFFFVMINAISAR